MYGNSALAAGLNKLGSITLFANGWPVAGLKIVRGLPFLSVSPEKLPFLSATVGTVLNAS
jgi:hypothetical protein